MEPIARVVEIIQGNECHLIRVMCPFCNKKHLHGGGFLVNPIHFGTRMAHCGRGIYEMVNK